MLPLWSTPVAALSLATLWVKFPQRLRVIWVIAGTVLAGLIIGFWASSRLQVAVPDSPASVPQSQALSEPASEPDPPPVLSDRSYPRPNPRLQRLRVPEANTNWDEQIAQILSSEIGDELKSRKLLELFPRLPVEGQIEVVQQLGEVLPDEEYASLEPYATNATLAEPVLEALLADLTTRSESVRLPTLLSIAEDALHPMSEQALELLEIYLGETYGTNWDQWLTNVRQRVNLPGQPELQDMESGMDPTAPE